MDKKLSQWAKEKNISYINAYRKFQDGKVDGAYKTVKGSIFVKDIITPEITNFDNKEKTLFEVKASDTKMRRNRIATDPDTNQFSNIEDGITPFEIDGSLISVKKACELCQKAYYNFDVFRNTIDLMTEFSVTNIRFRGGSKKSRELFTAIGEKVGYWGLQDMFYRENFRGSNVFIYRFDVEVNKKDIEKLRQVFGEEQNGEDKVNNLKSLLPNGPVRIPTRYIVLNPCDIRAGGNIDFSSQMYFKRLSGYELARLKNPKTPEDREVFDSLPEDVKKNIKTSVSVDLPLDPDKIYASFYKKQSYEPFAVPMGYPVLANINAKAELRKMDVAIARTMQQAILLITLGYESKDGKYQYPTNVAQSIQELFSNESVGRVLVADFTTKAEFVIPQIADILDPKKYEVIDRDINVGLNNILVGGEKFSNQAMKIQVFIERLKHAREQFKNDFLIPEIKRIARELGLKNYPVPYFEEINLKDELEFAKVYTRLIELGVLTPEEGVNAIETGTLPTPDESLESQKKFKSFKDQRLYQPIIGGGIGDQMELTKMGGEIDIKKQAMKPKPAGGRPKGTKSPKKVKPRKASLGFSDVQKNLVLAAKLTENVKASLKTEDENLINNLVEVIVSNEYPKNWEKSIAKYIKNPVGENIEMMEEVEETMYEHQTSRLLGAVLYHSQNA